MAKTLYVRTFSESIHDKLNDISQDQGVPVGSIIEEAVDEWIKHKGDAPKQHNLVLYSDEESLMYFLKKMEELTKQDWNRIILGPESHQGKKFLKKKQWIDVTISPYAQGMKNAEKYSSQVFNKVNKEAKGRASMFMGFLTGDSGPRVILFQSCFVRSSIFFRKYINDSSSEYNTRLCCFGASPLCFIHSSTASSMIEPTGTPWSCEISFSLSWIDSLKVRT